MAYIGKQPIRTALTSSDIEDGVITAAKIEDGAVVAAEIASNAVTTAKINADAVTSAKIADDAINSEHYTDGSIDTAHIADANVTTAKIADDSVTLAKMASGTDGNIISYDASGNPVAVATGNDGQVLTSTGAGSPPAFETLPASGITMADQWRRTAAMTITSTAQVLSANWEQVDTSGQGTIGSSMTQSSGIFTFPSTGLYFILVNQGFYDDDTDSRYFEFKIDATINNSSYTTQSRTTSSLKHINSNTFNMLTCNTYFNVTNTSNCKVRFKAESENNTLIGGDTAFNESQSYTFIRLGDSV